MSRYTEQDVLLALADIRNRKSERAACLDHDIPRSTIYGRNKESENHVLAAESQQRLSMVQEEHLSNWVLT